MAKLFGTDGIRSIAGEYPLDPPTVYRIGLALAHLGKKKVIIGRDTRASGVWIEHLLKQALTDQKVEVAAAGVLTTPGVSYLVRSEAFDAGVVISASHNPYRDNGIKIFANDGKKLFESEEERIEDFIERHEQPVPTSKITEEPDNELLTRFDEEHLRRYIQFVKQIPARRALSSLKIVLDCANGAAFHIAPQVFRELGAEVVTIHTRPDGSNINRDCGSLHPEEMARAVTDSGAQLGVAFDGDADRSIFADEQGNLVDGDYTLFILARHLKKRSLLNNHTVVSTVMANIGLEVALRREGIRMLRTPVGDRYVLDEMSRGNHSLGGEQSGHIIIREHSIAGDGILTALKIADIISREGQSLSQLCRGLEKFPQVLVNVRVREKRDFLEVPLIREQIQTVERRLGDRGRVVVRYSGTEPLARIMLEGENEQEIRSYADTIADRFRETLG